MLVNDLVDTGGITYAYRITEDVGVGPVDAVRSYVATDAIFRVGEVWRQIRAAGDAGVPVAVTDRMTLDLRRLIDRAGRWLLNYRPQPLAVGAEINRFAAKVAALTPRMSEWLRGDDRDIVAKQSAEFEAHGVSKELAYMVATGLYQYSLLDVIDIADIIERDAGGGRRHLLRADGSPRHRRTAHRGRPSWPATTAGIRWRAWRFATTSTARCVALCFDVLAVGEPDETGEQKIEEWELTNSSRVARARRTLTEIYAGRRARPGDAVGGGTADPQHDENEWDGSHWVTERFTTPVPVRWSDIDMYQHVNHAHDGDHPRRGARPVPVRAVRRRLRHHRTVDRRGPGDRTKGNCGWRIRHCR